MLGANSQFMLEQNRHPIAEKASSPLKMYQNTQKLDRNDPFPYPNKIVVFDF
jgi:hypothetical protein